MVLSDRQFDRTRQLAASLAGIELFDRPPDQTWRRSENQVRRCVFAEAQAHLEQVFNNHSRHEATI